MAYGITSAGFVVKPLQAIKDDLGAGLRGIFGATFDLEPESVNGQVIGAFSDRLADVWQLGKSVYDSAFPDSATGTQLDLVLALTAISRLPATKSKVDGTVTGTPGTVIGASALTASVQSNGAKFVALTGGTIGGGGTVSLEFTATTTGPKTAPAGTLTVIETPIAGVVSITNPLDHKVLGTDLETDPAARLRRDLTLRAIGSASAEAVRARVADIANVTDVVVFENESDTTDANSVPGHSIEVVVSGGLDATLAQAIFDTKAAGVGTYGTTTITSVVGPDGLSRSVRFSRPADVNVYHVLSIHVDPAVFPDNGTDQIKAAIVAYGALVLKIGTDVVSSVIIPSVFTIPGVLDVIGLPFIGTAPSPGSSATLAITNRQRARFDTSRITVTVV